MNDINDITQMLLSTPYAKTYKDEYIYVRCPLCGDSIKHLDKPHCSIWIKPGQPLIYHCWICEESGVVNHNFLKDLGINDAGMYSKVGRYNKSNTSSSSSKQYKFINPSRAAELKIPAIGDESYEIEKVNYLKNRMGIDYTKESLEYLRCITSLKKFLALNEIKVHPIWAKSVYYIERDYVGFLTSSRTTIIFRNIRENPKMRYIKYPIFQGIDLGESFYTIPTAVEPLAKEIDLHIAEGVMDIHGVFFHVCNANMENSIYVAVGGSGYKRVLRYFLNKGFLTNLNVHIYSDADKPIEWYNQLDDMRIWFNDLDIYYNRYEDMFKYKKGVEKIHIKDFGVRHYEHVWEYIVNSIFGSNNIEKYYPTTNYVFNDESTYSPSKLRPDTIFVNNDNFYILDSKYYKYGVTGINKDLPGTDSIQKQVTYGEFVNSNFNLDKQYTNIYNAFIIPYNKEYNSFNTNDKVHYCGYAKCNWKLNDQFDKKYLKIAVILIDTKTIIDSYFENDKKIKELLMKEIQKNKVE